MVKGSAALSAASDARSKEVMSGRVAFMVSFFS
jgi:hypothetical protein